MELGLSSKVALVTAASRGLGYACALELAKEGARVAICSRSMTRIQLAASRIAKATGAHVLAIRADVTKEMQLHRLVRSVECELGPIEILVSNTGNPPSGRFANTTDSDWELGTALCLRSPIILCRLILPGMIKRRFGRIIFLSSIFAREPNEKYVISSTLRAGLGAFAKCLVREVSHDGIRVNVVCLGYFDTPLLKECAGEASAASGKSAKRILFEWAKAIPSGQLGKPADLGSLVTYLASPMVGYLQGATIVLDGGLTQT